VSPHGQTVYSSAHPLKKWKQIAERIDFVFAEKESTLGQPPPKQHSSDGGFAGSAKRNNAEQVKPEQPEDTSSPKPDGGRKFEKIFRAYQFIGAVGQLGLQVVAKAEELYRIWAKPIWRVHGHGSKNTPGSVAAMVRDLKKLSRYESHQTALQAMLKLNGTLNEKLRYGESVYRRCRKPKFRVPKRSLIIVRDVGQANPKDVRFLMAKVARARAKILFVEQDWPRSVVVKQAQAMRPGEGRHFQSPEQKP